MKDIFTNVPLFAGLSEDELTAVMALASTTNVKKKNVILQEGDAGNALYIILEGSVKISYYAPDGREIIISILNSGDFFGEIALLDNQPRSATVTTLENSKLTQIRHRDFKNLLIENPQLTMKLLIETAKRLRRTNQVLERISTLDVPHRLYNFLKDNCAEQCPSSNAIFKQITLPTHQVIADQLSTSRETISRAIGTLKKEGIIKPGKDSKTICVDTEAIDALITAID